MDECKVLKMNDDLLRHNFRQKYLIWDFETANLSLTSGLPWQLGFCLAQGQKITQEFERKIWWENYEVSDQVAMMNHFNKFQYEKEARDPKEVLEEFDQYLYDPQYIIVTMNGLGFDCFIHNNWRKACGKKTDYSWMNRHIDILATFRGIRAGAKNPLKDDLLAWQYTFLNTRDKKVKASLSAQLKHYGITFNEADKHQALTDVKLTFEVFKKQLFELEI